MALRRTSHAVYDTQYHLVWCPKYIKDIFTQSYLREELFREIAEEYEFCIEALEVSEDHIHILISFPPRYSISQVVGTMKSISALELFKEHPSLKKRLFSGELWRRTGTLREWSGRFTISKNALARYRGAAPLTSHLKAYHLRHYPI